MTAPGRTASSKNMRKWWDVCEGRAMQDGTDGTINPERVFFELSKKLPDNCILSADSGTAANWYARDSENSSRHDGVWVWESGEHGSGGALRGGSEALFS